MRNLLFFVVLVSACGKNTEPPPPTTGTPNPRPESGPSKSASGKQSQAELMFGTVCATCHGADGRGNGPAAAALTIKPRNYTDQAWQASVTDEQIKEIILKGGADLGKSPSMPPSPHLESQPEVLDGLVQLIRRFGKK